MSGEKLSGTKCTFCLSQWNFTTMSRPTVGHETASTMKIQIQTEEDVL